MTNNLQNEAFIGLFERGFLGKDLYKKLGGTGISLLYWLTNNHACRQLFKELLRVKPELMQEISAEAFYRTEIARVKVSPFYESTPTYHDRRSLLLEIFPQNPQLA